MPYAIRKRGDDWEVINKDTGDVKGTHPSEAKAYEQLKAIYFRTKGESAMDNCEGCGDKVAVSKWANDINFYVVTYPLSSHSLLGDILFETTVKGMMNQVLGGLEIGDVYGVYKGRYEALRVATQLLKGV